MRRVLLSLLLICGGCEGTLVGPRDERRVPGGGGGGAVGPEEPGAVLEPMVPGPHRTSLGVRRLTVRELNHAAADVLGAREGTLTDDVPLTRFSNNAHGLSMSLPATQALTFTAEAWATERAGIVALQGGCAFEAIDETCLNRALTAWLPRAWRRPVRDEERTALLTLFTALRQTGTAREALEGVVVAALLSPSFLYRAEVEGSDGLDDFAIAARLSFFLWESTPDDALLAAARAGSLRTSDGRREQLQRMWNDPRTARTMSWFASQWLGAQHFTLARKEVLAGAPQTLGEDLKREFDAQVEAQLVADQGSVRNFLAGRRTVVTGSLARFYGLETTAADDEVVSLSLEGTARRGVLTSGLIIAAHSKESGYSVPQLGAFVRTAVLCQNVPAPPADIPALPPAAPTERTYRELFSRVTLGQAACSGCHTFINPPGFAYLAFDAIGRHRTLDEGGQPFDSASASFPMLDGKTVAIRDAADLSEQLAASQRVEACVARMLFEFSAGRGFDQADGAVLERLTAQWSSEQSLRPLVEALVTDDSFVHRGPLP